MSVAAKEIAQFEALAETAYTAMYDARPHNVKDHYEDAVINMQRAIDAAVAREMTAEAERLTKRRDHIESVYNHQFRYVGR
jgi:hypothetical protein